MDETIANWLDATVRGWGLDPYNSTVAELLENEDAVGAIVSSLTRAAIAVGRQRAEQERD